MRNAKCLENRENRRESVGEWKNRDSLAIAGMTVLGAGRGWVRELDILSKARPFALQTGRFGFPIALDTPSPALLWSVCPEGLMGPGVT